MGSTEKLATQGTQDKDKQTLENTEGTIKDGQYRETGNTGYTRQRQINKTTTQYVLDTTIREQTQITLIRHKSSYKQLEVRTNRLCGHHFPKSYIEQ